MPADRREGNVLSMRELWGQQLKQEGRQEGQQDIVANLLRFMTPEDVAQKANLPLSEVLKARDRKES